MVGGCRYALAYVLVFVRHVGALWLSGVGAVVREGGAELLAAIGAFSLHFVLCVIHKWLCLAGTRKRDVGSEDTGKLVGRSEAAIGVGVEFDRSDIVSMDGVLSKGCSNKDPAVHCIVCKTKNLFGQVMLKRYLSK